MISQKVRTNASVSYFFLGWLFLLARKNPNFKEPFVMKHSKYATKGHTLFFITYFAYEKFLSSFFSYSIPVIQITISHVIEMAFFGAITIFIIAWVYATQKTDDIAQNGDEKIFRQTGQIFEYQGAMEAERMSLLLAHVPFFGLMVARNRPNTVTITGARISSLFSLVYIILFSTTGFDSLSTLLLFAWTFALVWLASKFFLSDRYTVSPLLEKIPSIESVYLVARAFPLYLRDIVRMVLGKTETISLSLHIEAIRIQDARLKKALEEYFTGSSLPFKPFWIFIPGCNIVFIPKIFGDRTSKHTVAIGQGLTITFLWIVIGLIYGFSSPLELFLLFPIFYGIASVDAFVRIPLVYELYVIFNTLTFGLLKNKKRLEEAQRQNQSVSFKV